jgi:uncharacterized protein YkwD
LRLLLGLCAILCLGAVAIAGSGCLVLANTEIELYADVNVVRANAGLPALQPDQQLANIARFHANDMAMNHTFRHKFANGCTVICVMDALGVQHAWAGENIEVNNWSWSETAVRAVAKWQTTTEHLANMMNCHYTRFGAGVIPDDTGRIYISMVFEGDAAC